MKINEITKAEFNKIKKENIPDYNEWYDAALGLKNDNELSKKLTKTDNSNIFDYVFKDKKPIGQIADSLNKLISISKPLPKNIISYRGIVVKETLIENIKQSIDSNNQYIFRLKYPSSFTNSKSAAWDFAKPGGYRRTKESTLSGLLLEIVIPAGIKIGRLNLAFGVGREHILQSNTKIKLVRYRPYMDSVIFTGIVIL